MRKCGLTISNILTLLLHDSLTVDHIILHLMHLPLGLAHGVVHGLTLLGALLAAVGAEVSLAHLHLLVDGNVLIGDGAGLLKLLIAFLLLMGLELGDKGVMAPLLGLVDAGHGLGVLRVLYGHQLLDAGQAVTAHCQ